MCPSGRKPHVLLSTQFSIRTSSGNSARQREHSASSPWRNGVSKGPPWALSFSASPMIFITSRKMITAGTWYFLAHSWMADGMMYSWPWLLIRICLRKPAFQYPETIERTIAEVRSSGMGTVPVCPRWAKGWDAYQSGSATVQPVFCAISSHILVTMNPSSP